MNKEGQPRAEPQTGLIRIEKSINPEVVWGKEFRIPSIVGEGSGLGFKIENLHLPKDWETKIPKLKKINYEYIFNIFKEECEKFELKPGIMKYDSGSILRELTINTSPISRLYLDLEYYRENKGGYKSENIMSPLVAIILEKIAARILSPLKEKEEGEEKERGYPSIEGEFGRFYPRNLVIPKKFIKSGKALYSQEAFTIEASNILGRFGLTLDTTFFDKDNGLFTGIRLQEGNSCSCNLEEEGEFNFKNVDDPERAAALFGVVAAYINHLLEK